MPWTRDDADHLLRRAGFGASLSDVDRYFALGQAGAIDALVNYESTPDPTWDNDTQFPNLVSTDAYGSRVNLLVQFTNSTRPLQTRMLWFWHGHFTTSCWSNEFKYFRTTLQLYRANTLGNFGTLLNGVYKDAGMLLYLNGNGSNYAGPNQNFARECMELYTVGLGTFTETDVREAARSFTGWGVSWPDGAVLFDWKQWDHNPKTILGQTANFNGDSLTAMLAPRYETQWRLTSKLCRTFINEQLNAAEQVRLQQIWSANGGDVRAVVRAMLTGTTFWDPVHRWTITKTPMDYALGLVHRFEIALDRSKLVDTINRISGMGYAVFDPPNVAGYRPTNLLVGTSSLLARYQFASKVINEWASDDTIAKFSAGWAAPFAPSVLITQVASRMGSMPLAANTRAIIENYISTAPATSVTQLTRNLAFMIACTAEYQLM